MADFELMTNLNLNGQELINARTENVASLPTPSAEMNGRRVYLTTDNCTYECRNGAWVKMAASSEVTAALNAGKVTVEKSGDSYIVKQNGTQVGVAINVPKDMVVESGEIVAGTWSDGTFTPSTSGKGKALKLVIANGGGTVYIDVKDLVDVYTGSTGTTVNITIDSSNKISAAIVNGSIVEAHLASAFVTTLKSATITTPTASSTQATAGTKTISALFQTIVNNIKQLFTTMDTKVDKVSGKGLSTNDYTTAEKTKLGNLKQSLGFESKVLTGKSGAILASEHNLNVNYPVQLQAYKNGSLCGLAMSWTSDGQIEWSSNVELTTAMNVKIIAQQTGIAI